MTYPVNNAIDEAGNGNGKAVAWEKAFIQLAKVQLFICFLHSLACGLSSVLIIKRNCYNGAVRGKMSYLLLDGCMDMTGGAATFSSV